MLPDNNYAKLAISIASGTAFYFSGKGINKVLPAKWASPALPPILAICAFALVYTRYEKIPPASIIAIILPP